MPFDVKPVDQEFYAQRLAGFLPHRIFDFHTHIWLKEFAVPLPPGAQAQTWPKRVAEENPIEDLLRSYERLLPGHEVTCLLFGWPERDTDLEQNNAYVATVSREIGWPGLIVSTPEWSASEVERRVREGGFAGLKPYVNLAPLNLTAAETTIYDYLPCEHLELADQHGWAVMLHIPRPGRLKDPLNLRHLVEIDRMYPNARVVIAHVGRAYCPEDVGDAMAVLGTTTNVAFDFSANTSAWVIEQALRAFGPKRLLFGSDLPILRMRMRRICEEGFYVNLVPPGLYGDLSGDAHMRVTSPAEGAHLSFFLYEELAAFREAAESVGLTAGDLEDVFYHNAANLLAHATRERR